MKKVLLFAAILILLAAPIAAQDDEEIFPRDLEDLRVGDETQMVATVVNPLPVEDQIELTLRGDAINDGLLTVNAVDNGDITCPETYRCNVYVPPEGEMDVNLSVEATAIGQGDLEGVANSSTTGLASEDHIAVRVDTGFVGVDVSAPGITGIHVLLVAALAGMLVFWTARRRTPEDDS